MKLPKQEQEKIIDILLLCNANSKKILKHLNKLNLYDCSFSLRQTAKILHISKTRVKQLEDKALKKLRDAVDDLELLDDNSDDAMVS